MFKDQSDWWVIMYCCVSVCFFFCFFYKNWTCSYTCTAENVASLQHWQMNLWGRSHTQSDLQNQTRRESFPGSGLHLQDTTPAASSWGILCWVHVPSGKNKVVINSLPASTVFQLSARLIFFCIFLLYIFGRGSNCKTMQSLKYHYLDVQMCILAGVHSEEQRPICMLHIWE